jgi:signal transduction histidine kinase
VVVAESVDGEVPADILNRLEELREIEEIEYEIYGAPLDQVLQFSAIASLLVGLITGIWVSRSLSRPIRDLADTVRGIGARDLSQRVEVRGNRELTDLGQEINRMAENLERADAVRRNLMADVAHELRTPLTVLQGNLGAMLDRVVDPNDEEIGRLFLHTQHMSKLVEDLRELALAESGELHLSLEPTDLAKLAESVVSLHREAASAKGVDLGLRAKHDLPILRLDRACFRQILHNLLSNALRHTPTGGSIRLRLRSKDDEVLLSVSDDGAGIAQEDLASIFDRFYRVESSRRRDSGGSGLGLAISKALVEAHGGTITAESPGPTCGSTFTIRLPLLLLD